MLVLLYTIFEISINIDLKLISLDTAIILYVSRNPVKWKKAWELFLLGVICSDIFCVSNLLVELSA